MELTMKKLSYALRIFYLMSFLVIFSMPTHAQTADPDSSGDRDTSKKSNNSKLDLDAEMGHEYLDNVFRLTGIQITRLENNAPEEQISGRYKDMESADDIIAHPFIRLKYNSDSPLGGKFGLTSWIRYNYYMKNNKSSFPEGRIRVRNSIGKNGALGLEADFVSGFFKKNYISGINDVNRNGNIIREERIFSEAVYDEYKGTLAYNHKLINNKGEKFSGLDIQPYISIEKRTFNSTFSNRDKDVTLAGLKATLEFISKIDLEMIYKYETDSSPNDEELVLYDETIADIDVNGDGRIRSNAPLITKIYRSCTRNTIEINPSYKLSKNILLSLGYERRMTDYKSDNILDIEHYDNKATRQEIKSAIDMDIIKDWSARFEYSRRDDNDDEDGDYLQNHFILTIRYDFI